ncbi:hypothetical protein CVT24_007598 [Panaeolus cyanescens]|uniref:Uncharacterized protein n=1 Tax=Panaeolus cyanescens TaxID=181874 RepID=A0A409YKH8_9AGAR|nr:hypothetical protein CVT24_007598 [Panaeolus cyanescens]
MAPKREEKIAGKLCHYVDTAISIMGYLQHLKLEETDARPDFRNKLDAAIECAKAMAEALSALPRYLATESEQLDDSDRESTLEGTGTFL